MATCFVVILQDGSGKRVEAYRVYNTLDAALSGTWSKNLDFEACDIGKWSARVSDEDVWYSKVIISQILL